MSDSKVVDICTVYLLVSVISNGKGDYFVEILWVSHLIIVIPKWGNAVQKPFGALPLFVCIANVCGSIYSYCHCYYWYSVFSVPIVSSTGISHALFGATMLPWVDGANATIKIPKDKNIAYHKFGQVLSYSLDCIYC